VPVHDVGDILRAGHLLIVDTDDQISAEVDLHIAVHGDLIAAMQPRTVRGAVWQRPLDQHTIFDG
jgi:hypothetical protein